MGRPADASGEAVPEMICRNRRARYDFELLATLECGILLAGSEVKSLRAHKVSLEEAYVRVINREVWLIGCDIAEYPQATYLNHEPRRPRKLLVHRREVSKFAEQAKQKGLTLVPLEMYILRGRIKLQIALARGKKMYDKRQKLKQDSDKRDMQQAVRKNAKGAS